jgi:hypothetical protein
MLELVTTSLADAQDRRLMLQQAEAEAAYIQKQRDTQEMMGKLQMADLIFGPEEDDKRRRYLSDVLASPAFAEQFPGLAEAYDPSLIPWPKEASGTVQLRGQGRGPSVPLTPEKAAEEAGLVKGPGLIDAFGEAIGLPESMSRSRRTAEEVVDEIIGYGEEAQKYYDLQDDIIRYIEEGLSRSEIMSELNRTAREFEIDPETIAFLWAMYEPMMG